MNIAIVAPTPIPFLIGGAEKFFWGLQRAINQHTQHVAELIKVPCDGRDFWSLIDGCRRFQALDLNYFDAVISTKDPAWLVHHPRHYLYLQHRCRGVYDLYPESLPTRLGAAPLPGLRSLYQLLERAQAPALFAASSTSAFTASAGRRMVAEILAALAELPPDLRQNPAFNFPGPLTRAVIHALDRAASGPHAIAGYSAIAANVVRRRDYFPSGVNVSVIHHPTDLEGLHDGSAYSSAAQPSGAQAEAAEWVSAADKGAGCTKAEAPLPASAVTHPACRWGSAPGRYIFTASRLESLKRVDLLITAFKKVKADVEFLIAGTGGQLAALEKLAADDSRIRFLGFISDADLIEFYAGALFVPFVPYDEDYGLITVEAMQSGKPVLSVHDAGGVCELVEDGVNGRLTEPRAGALAAAMRELLADPGATATLGRQARLDAAAIDWPTTAARLLRVLTPADNSAASFDGSIAKATSAAASGKRRLLAANTFAVGEPVSGGQKRIFHLFKELAAGGACEVVLVSLAPGISACETRHLAPGFIEHLVPLTPAFIRAERHLRQNLGASVGDIAAIEGWCQLPALMERLKAESAQADLLVASHPYLYYALRAAGGSLPLWYDAHNVEYEMKAAILPPSAGREAALALVRKLEEACFRDAVLVSAVSETDAATLTSMYGPAKGELIVAANGMDFSAAGNLAAPGEDFCSAAAGEAEPLPAALPFSLEFKAARRRRLFRSDAFSCIFLGSYHGPNVEALVHVEKLARVFPEVLFLVVGSVGEAPAASRLPDNVKVFGVLSEAAKNLLLQAADLALNPVESGSGSNLKILEYLAFGLPVLTTPCGGRGYAFAAEKHLYMAESKDFAGLLEKIIAGGRAAAAACAADGRTFAATRYDWRHSAAAVGSALASIRAGEKNEI